MVYHRGMSNSSPTVNPPQSSYEESLFFILGLQELVLRTMGLDFLQSAIKQSIGRSILNLLLVDRSIAIMLCVLHDDASLRAICGSLIVVLLDLEEYRQVDKNLLQRDS